MHELEDLLGYRFKNHDLLNCALTHRSVLGHGLTPEVTECNERMEFLGDAIIGLMVSRLLYQTYPQASAGDLSVMKGHLISRKYLARIADSINLGDFLKLGKGEVLSNGAQKQSILAGAMEAVIAALYLDGGWGALSKFLLPRLQKEMENVPPSVLLDAKSKLQALTQLHYHLLPKYRLIAQGGLPHDPIFLVEAKVGHQVLGIGEGKTKRQAEQEAAKAGLSGWERNHQG